MIEFTRWIYEVNLKLSVIGCPDTYRDNQYHHPDGYRDNLDNHPDNYRDNQYNQYNQYN